MQSKLFLPRRAASVMCMTFAMLLSACATVSPLEPRHAVGRLVERRMAALDTAEDSDPPALAASEPESVQAVSALLQEQPLQPAAAVRIALLNNPALQASFATLAISEAQRVQASRLPNPHFAFGRLAEGSQVEFDRMLRFNVLDLLTLPWRARAAEQQGEMARLRAAQDVLRLAADTRKAWFHATAAQQIAQYMQTAHEAAQAGAELARRMAAVGNWSRLQLAREQLTLADIAAQHARAEQAAVSAREKLVRLLGLSGTQAQLTLPERLPDIPTAPQTWDHIEAQAISERLDVRAARDAVRNAASAQGLARASGIIAGLELGVQRNTTFDGSDGSRTSARGWELEMALPIFDQGQAGNASAQARTAEAAARLKEAAVRARSETREAYHGYRTAWDLARHYRDEIVPLRKRIGDETLLRYNGMLASVWDLLAETRNHVAAINGAIAAQRDFWIADTDLRMVRSGTSPGALQSLGAESDAGPANTAQGH
jgi:outer membrane protein, multidrug efflux system